MHVTYQIKALDVLVHVDSLKFQHSRIFSEIILENSGIILENSGNSRKLHVTYQIKALDMLVQVDIIKCLEFQ